MATIPNEGKITRATPIRALDGQKIVLFVNAVVPGAGTTYAGLTLATFSGYAAVAPAWGGIAIVNGKAQWVAAGALFSHNGGGVANNVKGWALVRESVADGNTILALELLAVAKDFAVNGDTLTITATHTETGE